MFFWSRRVNQGIAALLAVVSACAIPKGGAYGQTYDGCFVGGRQVADSMCNGGSSGGGGTNGAAMSTAGTLGYALGSVLGKMLRDSLVNQSGTDESTARSAADQAAAMQHALEFQKRMQRERESEKQAQRHRFEIDKQDLLNEVQQLDDSGADSGNAAVQLGSPGDAGSPRLRQLETSANGSDSSTVDLRGARTTIVDPRRMNGTDEKGPHQAASFGAMALQLSTDQEMRYLFPDAPSLWPGSKNPGARLLNPLREREAYLKLLVAEESRFPDQREQIEKLRSSLDSDAARRQRLSEFGGQIALQYNKTVAAADSTFNTQLTKVLESDQTRYGVADRQALFDKSRQDLHLAKLLQDQTKPLLDARAKAVEKARNRAMADMFDAFDRVNPDAR